MHILILSTCKRSFRRISNLHWENYYRFICLHILRNSFMRLKRTKMTEKRFMINISAVIKTFQNYDISKVGFINGINIFVDGLSNNNKQRGDGKLRKIVNNWVRQFSCRKKDFP